MATVKAKESAYNKAQNYSQILKRNIAFIETLKLMNKRKHYLQYELSRFLNLYEKY